MVTGSGARAAAFWARQDIRRRWRSLVLLGVLIGVIAGCALSAWSGARRTDTSLARLRTQTNAADAVAFPSQVGVGHPDWARLAARPEVASVAVWDLLFGNYDDQPGALIFGSANGTYLDKVDKPVVLQGRMFNPRSTNEVVIDENAVNQAPPVGGTFTYRFYAPGQVDETGAPHGPKVVMRVVGVVREVPEFLFVPDGQIMVSPGFMARYGTLVDRPENADIVLRHGQADIGALRHDVNTLIARGTPVLDVHATSRRVTTTLSVETIALLLLAAAVLVGGGILVAQVLERSASTIVDDAAVLRAFGMSRDQVGLASGLSHLVPAAVAVPVAFIVALLASPHFPVALGRRIDPDVGYHVDWTIIGPGIGGAVTTVLVASILIGRGTRHGSRRPEAYKTQGGLRQWVPVAIGLGATMAFEPGRGRRRIPVVPALLAAVVAVTGVVASLTIDRGITSALKHPELAGVTWDASVSPTNQAQTGRNISPALASHMTKRDGVRAAAVVDRDVINVGTVGAPVFSVRPIAGSSVTPITFTLISGRPPEGLGEVAIGPATAKDLHVGTGDTVSVGASHVRARIVGESLFPGDVHSEFDEGIWLSPALFDVVVPPIGRGGSITDGRVVAVQFESGGSLRHDIGRLQTGLGQLSYYISPPDPPEELTNLQNVRSLPEVLAAFLGLIAVTALASVLFTAGRRRRHDFSVLRVLGMTRGNIRTILSSQGTAIGLFGLVIGIPLGLAVGRLGWRGIAERVPLSDVPPLALAAALLLIPVTLIVANALAIGAGRIALVHPPAEELRAE
jgi:ABC-type lipoprotein release transport system permease subunit